MVDSILSYAATDLVNQVTDQYCKEGKEMLERIRAGAAGRGGAGRGGAG